VVFVRERGLPDNAGANTGHGVEEQKGNERGKTEPRAGKEGLMLRIRCVQSEQNKPNQTNKTKQSRPENKQNKQSKQTKQNWEYFHKSFQEWASLRAPCRFAPLSRLFAACPPVR